MKTPSMQAKSLLSALMLAIYTVASLPVLAAQPNNGASAAMLEAAALQLEFGEVEQAGDTLERALRIEPNNPATLHHLGQVRLQQGQFEQAVALATRSNALARNDAELRKRNLQLIQAARQAMGPGVAYGVMAEVDEPAEIRVGLDKEVERGREAGIAAADGAGSPALGE
jgi:tetratricopeptide (TPR) repeat protein